eukprot:7263349-Heterocapsa_arctica.AAC.1
MTNSEDADPGGLLRVRVSENDEVPDRRLTYWDDVRGGMLDAEKKTQAHGEELDWCRKSGVWEKTSCATMDTEGGEAISSRWVDTDM